MKKILTIIAISMLAAASSYAQKHETVIFKKGDNGYHTFRIPALIQTKSGDILAFAVGRKNSGGDSGDIDMVMKRSTDGGKTWGNIITVWDDQENVCGNPAPVVVSQTGRVILLSTWNHGKDHTGNIRERTGIDTRRVFMMHSDDNGLTWSKPEEITGSVKLPEWTWYATGPCHALETSKGRLIVPCNHGISVDGKPAGSHSHVIYSDDRGMTWNIGGCPLVGDESTVVELSDGSIMMNMRGPRDKERERKYSSSRFVAVSHDGGETFCKPYIRSKLDLKRFPT